MRIEVTPECLHPDGFRDHGVPLVGQHVIVSSEGVCLDGEWVIKRDRRAKKNREPGHPWIAEVPWTGFSVRVEPNAK